jgi:tetratricopeptide (TPR) repeat protein
MIMMTIRVGLVLIACAGGCATTGTRSGTATPQTPPPTTSQKPAPAAAIPGDAKALLRASLAAVESGNLAEARVLFDQARPLAASDRDLDLRSASVAIALFSNQGDYDAAARFVLDAIRRRNGDPTDGQLFTLHNWMAILRQAQGDLPGAILECAERTAVGYEGTWEPAAERLQQARFKDDWHRAYLFRMYAEQLTGTRREGALLAAENARKAYAAAGGYADSTAVLDALFAMYDRRWDDVRAAVHRVDIAKADDEEDLYILFSALDSTGDHEAAAAIRRRIEHNPPTWGMWRGWLKNDTDGTPPSMKHFSPRYPTGKRP